MYALRPQVCLASKYGEEGEAEKGGKERRGEKDQDLGDRVTPRDAWLWILESRLEIESAAKQASVTQSPLCVPDLPSFFIPHYPGSVADTQPP